MRNACHGHLNTAVKYAPSHKTATHVFSLLKGKQSYSDSRQFKLPGGTMQLLCSEKNAKLVVEFTHNIQ